MKKATDAPSNSRKLGNFSSIVTQGQSASDNDFSVTIHSFFCFSYETPCAIFQPQLRGMRGSSGMDYSSSEFFGHVSEGIIAINRNHVFSFEEAQEVLPVIIRITKNYSQRVEALIDRLDAWAGAAEELAIPIEDQVNNLIQDWQNKVQKLGAMPKGLWIADFDSGDGYFCWKYPEPRIEYWHRYSDGFSNRRSVSEKNAPISFPKRVCKKILSITPLTSLPSSETTD